ncbi:MAG TPA: transcriptional regulator, partial [Candidatus Fraserbacteria bacterium]|nr:transcriptional regulator [Candidatus Fraserbacteria bacterium]
GACGDGGMIITDDDELAEKLRLLRVHGSRPKYYHQLVGYNSRLDALQAAILRAKLPYLDRWSAARAAHAAGYDRALAELPGIETPPVAPERTHIYHQYTVRVLGGRRDEVRKSLKERGIGTGIYYPLPLHLQACFASLGYREGDFPQAERASREVLSLPIFPELAEEEREYVVSTIQQVQQAD